MKVCDKKKQTNIKPIPKQYTIHNVGDQSKTNRVTKHAKKRKVWLITDRKISQKETQ